MPKSRNLIAIRDLLEKQVEKELRNFSAPEQVKCPFSTFDEYKEYTGKRFRMNPDQKARGISRDMALEETIQAWIDKNRD